MHYFPTKKLFFFNSTTPTNSNFPTSHNPFNSNSSFRDLNRKQWFSIQKMQFLGRRKMDKEVLSSHLRKDSDKESLSFWEMVELSENMPTIVPRHFSHSSPSGYSAQGIFKVSSGRGRVLCNVKGYERWKQTKYLKVLQLLNEIHWWYHTQLFSSSVLFYLRWIRSHKTKWGKLHFLPLWRKFSNCSHIVQRSIQK